MIIWNPWHGCHKVSEGCQHCYMYFLDGKRGIDTSKVYRTENFNLPVQRRRDGRFKLPSGMQLYVGLSTDFFVEEADEWRNTIIAEVDSKRAGMLTAYDGRYYHDMRIRTMALVKQHLGVEFPGMEDEAVAGEYYLDSLAVIPEYRGRGIGRQLLQQGIKNGDALSLNITLAVDPINERAKKLYQSLGFIPSGTLFIFGHDYEKMIILTSH